MGAHSLSRYKLKFSPDKIDTMIVQAVNLLDDLDKELNNYIMRCREWYGWHFPELGGSIQEKLDLSCVYDSKIGELMRCIRSQISGLISGLPDKEMAAMELGLAHSLSRYKLKFSPDKIDTMIV